jgi:tetratricopeptide (TPR) repeat protein
MKHRKRIVIVLLFLLIAGGVTRASDMPYRAYTYDEWGQPIESPSGYEATLFVDGIMLGSGPLKSPADITAGPDGRLYILDSGNGRIVITDDSFRDAETIDAFQYNGQSVTLNDPQGIFVGRDGTIYIADTGNSRVLRMGPDGIIDLVIEKPASELFPQGTAFAPQKVLADRTGTIFVICKGVYYGAVLFDPDGSFLGYFGSNKVELSADLLIDRVWKRLMSKENRDKLASYIPVEFTNFTIDAENFIYSCTNYSNSNFNMIRKINPMGINILETKANKSYQGGFGDLGVVYFNAQPVATRMQDVSISPQGHITALDFTRGRIFQYDQDANILFAFGGLGVQNGMFRYPIALEHLGDRICVLDRTTGGVTIFELTEFGKTVHQAMALFNDGKYVEAMEPWRSVLRYNSNYNLAYIGLGKAFQETGDPEKAMEYFRIGYYRDGFDKTFNEYRNITMRRIFPYLFAVIVLAILYGYTRKTVFVQKLLNGPRKAFAGLRSRIGNRATKGGGKDE